MNKIPESIRQIMKFHLKMFGGYVSILFASWLLMVGACFFFKTEFMPTISDFLISCVFAGFPVLISAHLAIETECNAEPEEVKEG